MMLALRVTSLTHAWVYMNRAHGRALVVGVLMLLIGPALGVAESPDHRSPSGIQQAKRATLGVLQPGEDAQRQGGKAHFVMRGTALHLRDGYLLTARHVAEQDEAGRRALAKQITVLTADLDEVPATFVGMNAFLDLAVYRLP